MNYFIDITGMAVFAGIIINFTLLRTSPRYIRWRCRINHRWNYLNDRNRLQL